MEREPYREEVFINDPEVVAAAQILVVELMQRVMDTERERRIVTLEALRSYCDHIADAHNGFIPIEDMHVLLDDILMARK